MATEFTPTLRPLRAAGTVASTKKAAGPAPGNAARVGAARGDAARGVHDSLVDYGPRTRLMMDLTAAIAGSGRPWQALRPDVLAQLPGELGSLQLSFKKALEQADSSANVPGNATYTNALKQLKTAFTMACILQRI